MVTTNVNNTCSTDFDGTSAACPIAAGIYALVLQVNPNITWRDAQHLTVWTSSYEAIRNKCVWNRNARGFLFHEKVGFGLMNAHEMVKTALKWVNVDNQHICEVNPTTRNGEIVALESSNSTTSTAFIFETDGCKSQTDSQISYLEHVVVQATIESEYRGGLMIILFSPSGTTTTLLNARWEDSSTSGFRDWKFMTVHLWGENPSGKWAVSVVDMNLHAIFGNGTIGKGKVKNMKLILYGTSTIPKYLENGPRRYKDGKDVAELLKTKCSKS
ncbi:PCSK1 (predicted) [Pycnogonum litorale]